MSKTYFDEELDRLLDDVADYSEDWQAVIDMVAEADKPQNKKILFEYLRLLVPRLKQMRREFNRVMFVDGGYVLTNYDFKMYSWAKKRGLEDSYITPNKLIFPPDFLTAEEKEQFQTKLEK